MIFTVENQLVSAGSLVEDTAGESEFLLLVGLARLQVAKFLEELGVIVSHVELVGVGVGLGVLED